MKYLVTGATGRIGGLVTRRLLALGERPCLLVRDEKKARAEFGDRVDLRVGDLAGTLTSAFADVETVFLVNSGPELGQRDRHAALAAREAGVQHLVKLSTLDTRNGVGTGPWHAMGEAAIRESGVGFTFVQSAAFMSNALSWSYALKRGVMRSSTGDGKIAFIHPDDLADVCVRAMRSTPRGESWVITGPEALSYRQMASMLVSSARFEDLSDDAAREIALGFGEGPAYAEAIVDIWRSIREDRVSTVTNEVERLLGRAPKPFSQWARENAAAFQR